MHLCCHVDSAQFGAFSEATKLDVILKIEKENKMVKSLYTWIVAQLEENGYVESDIILISDENQKKTLQPEDFKRLTNVDYALTVNNKETKSVIMISTEKLHIHLKDGSIAFYNPTSPDHDWEIHENTLLVVKSAPFISTAETIPLKLNLNIENSSNSYCDSSVQDFFGWDSTLKVDVDLRGEDLSDYYVIMRQSSTFAMVLDTKAKVLGMNCGMTMEEEEFNNLIPQLGTFPIVFEDKFFEELMNKIQLRIGRESAVPDFSGMVNFFYKGIRA